MIKHVTIFFCLTIFCDVLRSNYISTKKRIKCQATRIDISQYLYYHFAGTPSTPLSHSLRLRVILHGHHPDDATTDGAKTRKLIHLPDSIEDLLNLAGKHPKEDNEIKALEFCVTMTTKSTRLHMKYAKHVFYFT